MKKTILVLFVLLGFSFSAQAQKGKVSLALSYIDQGLLDKAKTAIEAAELNEKTSSWAATYFVKGKLCQEVFQSDAPFNSLYTDPLQEAYASYEKALTLDDNSSIKKRMVTEMTYSALARDFYNQGSARFQAKDYSGALSSFKSQIKVSESDEYTGVIDTGMYYNAGLAAYNSGKLSEAAGFFTRCTEFGYMGMKPYVDIQTCYLEGGDTIKAEKMIKTLISRYPSNTDAYLLLINLYLRSNRNAEAMSYIESAKRQDPENYMLFYVSGVLNLNQDNHDIAIRELTRSVQLKPDYFDSQYASGLAFLNKAVDMNTRADQLTDEKKYIESLDEIITLYIKAVPYLEKASQLKTDDPDTLSRLQELYYRLKRWNPEYNQKYRDVKARLAAIRK